MFFANAVSRINLFRQFFRRTEATAGATFASARELRSRGGGQKNKLFFRQKKDSLEKKN